jgi:hypothetical protein
VIVALGVGPAVGASEAASTSRLLADCRDGVIQGPYSEKLVRRALRTSPAQHCEAALRFELAAISMSEDVVRDCYEDGKLDGRYTREELRIAERDMPSDVDEYSDCRSVIVSARGRTPSSKALARQARRAAMPLTSTKARRYAQRLGDRSARRRTRVKYAKRVSVRAVRLQAHYERTTDDGITRCYAEILVTRSSRSGRVASRRLRKVCA